MDASTPTQSPFLPGTSIQYAQLEDKAKYLLSRAIKVGDCWECHLTPNHKGYSSTSIGRNFKIGAHRIILFVIDPEMRPELMGLHSCDNPRCIRPDHLFPGTAQDNTDDMLAKGRASNTDETCSHQEVRKQYTGKWIKQLLDQGLKGVQIAHRLKISTSTISNYINPNGVYHAYLK